MERALIYDHTSGIFNGVIRSVGQRVSKLLAVKVGILQRKSAASAIPAKLSASAFRPGSSLPWVKSFSKFDGQ